jgi:hypothetical protein
VAGWGERVWLVQRPRQGVWAGLWSLPEFDSPQALGRWAGWPGDGRSLPPFVHVLTHLDWTLPRCAGPLPARLPRSWQADLLAARWPHGRWVGEDRGAVDGPAGADAPAADQARPLNSRPEANARPCPQVAVDQLQPHHRVVQRHQLLLGGQEMGSSLAPAVGHPAGIVQPEAAAKGSGGRVRRSDAMALAKACTVGAPPAGHARASGSQASAADCHRPSSLLVGTPSRRKRARAGAAHAQDAGLFGVDLVQRASTPMSSNSGARWRPHLGALAQADHAERLRCAGTRPPGRGSAPRRPSASAARRGTARSAAGTAAGMAGAFSRRASSSRCRTRAPCRPSKRRASISTP